MNKEFVPYELAVKLKALGFEKSCFGGFYDNGDLHIQRVDFQSPLEGFCLSPLFQQAFRWFREKYNLFGCIDLHSCIPPHWFVRIDNIVTNDYVFHSEDEQKKFITYEEAELACLTKLIEIVEQTKN